MVDKECLPLGRQHFFEREDEIDIAEIIQTKLICQGK